MSLYLASESFERRSRIARPLRLLASAFILTLLHSAADAQNSPSSMPAVTFNDPVAAARCLGGESCTGPASPVPGPFESVPPKAASAAVQGPVCAAEETLKQAPAALKSEALAFARSNVVARCRQEAIAVAPDRARAEAATDDGPLVLSDESKRKVNNYFAACFTPRKILNRGPVTPAERNYLREHVGLIVQRQNPNWSGLKPICEAARLGRFVITAARCISADAREHARPGSYFHEIGFRFFDHPTVYGLAWRGLNSLRDSTREKLIDFAVLEIIDAPVLDEAIEPQIGNMRLFDDFIATTTSFGMRSLRGLESGLSRDLSSVVHVRNNTLCRPAYITADGLFLHACYAEGIFNAGAPFFQRQRGQLVFVGIQAGETGSLQDPSLAACARGLPKFGVVVSPDALIRTMFR